MKRFIALSLIAALWLAAALCPAAAEPVYTDSGCVDIPKLTKPQQVKLLDDAPATSFSRETDPSAQLYDTAPSFSAPYAAGAVKEAVLRQTADRLNALRTIAGLPTVTLDAELCAQAQYGAVLIAVSQFSHFPPRPADMAGDFYDAGLAATSSSNLFAGLYFTYTPDGFMDDSDSGNIPMLGHRRWQLNPSMGKVGFGFVYNAAAPYQLYTAEKVFDSSGSFGDYEFISWPPSGNFPVSGLYWANDTAFSLTPNPRKYTVPDRENLTVTLRRQADGKTWTFSGGETYSPADARYFNVNCDNYGVPGCIIFRPDGAESYEGVYTVTLEGLLNSEAEPVALAYQIDFYDPADYRGQEQAGQSGGKGDVDGDGYVTSTDARMVLQLAVEKIDESDLPFPGSADADGDNSITSTDARLILQKSVGKITAWP